MIVRPEHQKYIDEARAALAALGVDVPDELFVLVHRDDPKRIRVCDRATGPMARADGFCFPEELP